MCSSDLSITSPKGLTPNTVTFGATRDFGYKIRILRGHNSAYNRVLERLLSKSFCLTCLLFLIHLYKMQALVGYSFVHTHWHFCFANFFTTVLFLGPQDPYPVHLHLPPFRAFLLLISYIITRVAVVLSRKKLLHLPTIRILPLVFVFVLFINLFIFGCVGSS